MIIAEKLTKQYLRTCAVDHLNLHVGNELFVFLGPNGAGKTTSIKMMTGLIKPTEGRVHIAGHDMLADPMKAKSVIGYVPEHPYLYDKLTAFEFVLLMADLYQVPRNIVLDRLKHYLNLFELTSRQDELIEEFSHGMKRKIALISALISDPEVLFLDEPTAGLDPKAAHRLKLLLRERVDQGKTVFMTTHILELAEKMADRIGIIHQGKLLKLDTLSGLLSVDSHRAESLETIFLRLTETKEDSVGIGSD